MDLAEEVGYLKGMQRATQIELENLNDAVDGLRATTATKHDLAVLRTELSDKIDEAVAKIQGGSGTQQALSNQSIWQTILKAPITPMVIVVLAMALVMAMMFSAQTGRSAASFVPYPAAVPLPPGGSATSTTTVTSPP